MKNITVYFNIIYSLIIGLLFSFMPKEFLQYINAYNAHFVIMIQFLGAFYLSYCMMNWFSRSSLLGGIYGRSIVMANLLFYVMTAFALFKLTTEHTFFIVLAILHTFFAISYYLLMTSNPLPKKSTS